MFGGGGGGLVASVAGKDQIEKEASQIASLGSGASRTLTEKPPVTRN